MSLIPNQAYANPLRPLWAAAGSGGGVGPTGPIGPTGPAGGGTGSYPTDASFNSIVLTTTITDPAGKPIFPTQIFQHEEPSGTPGGTAPGTGTFYPRSFNAAYPPLDIAGNSQVIPGLSYDSGTYQFNVPNGTFMVSGEVGGLMTVEKARLYDAITSNVIALGTSVGDDNRTNYSTFQIVSGFSSNTVEVQFAGATSTGTQDWGQATGFGDNEVYARVTFTKLV